MTELIPELKDRLDSGTLSLVAAVQFSCVPDDVQTAVSGLDKPVSADMAVKIREKGTTAADVERIVCGEVKKRKLSGKSVRISKDVYEKYFKESKADEATQIIEQALAAWFEGKEACHV